MAVNTTAEKNAQDNAEELEQILESVGKVVVDLRRPFEFCGETYEKLEMDFDGLTGRDIEAIDEELRKAGQIVFRPAWSHVYQRYLAAKAAGVPNDMIEALPARDYNRVVEAAQAFLSAPD